MVAVINTGHSIRSIFTYNENKVSLGFAQCIGEGNYPMGIDQLSSLSKLNLLLKQLELNENVKRNSVHISLNFDPDEKDLTKEKLMKIADTYMEKIGFGTQPYLVYQHHDAGHPHIHIVSIKVQSDGKRIDMQNIGKNQSETARREIENTFNLVRAESKKKESKFQIEPIYNTKITYGTAESKKAISKILNAVIPSFKYTTIGELNAVLNLYNVTAEKGRENSKMFLHKGLVYRILNDNKQPVGVPIKASSFHLKPTLKNLEENFSANKKTRITDLKRIKNAIDLSFIKNSKTSFTELEKALRAEGILCVCRTSPQGQLYGITYVDNTTRCSCNGSALGAAYAAKGIQERCGIMAHQSIRVANIANTASGDPMIKNSYKPFISEWELQKIIESVIGPEFTPVYNPNQLRGRRKKRKSKGQSGNQ